MDNNHIIELWLSGSINSFQLDNKIKEIKYLALRIKESGVYHDRNVWETGIWNTSQMSV